MTSRQGYIILLGRLFLKGNYWVKVQLENWATLQKLLQRIAGPDACPVPSVALNSWLQFEMKAQSFDFTLLASDIRREV